MVSDETKAKLRANALKHGLGGRVFIPVLYDDATIQTMVKHYLTHPDPLTSFFNDTKIHKTIGSWKNEVGHKVKEECRGLIYYYLAYFTNSVPTCPHCGAVRTPECYTPAGNMKSIFCKTCIDNRVWVNSTTSDATKNAIANGIRKFYQSPQGKVVSQSISTKNSANMKAFNQTPKGKATHASNNKKRKKTMKQKILNGQFTPNSNNRNTHWDSSFNGKVYRSSWEALYQYHNPADLHEKLRISYEFNGESHVYIVDFVNYETMIATEIKPKECCNDVKFMAKYNALLKWASDNNFTARIVDMAFLKALPMPTSFAAFDDNTERKIRKLYATTCNQNNP
jgi:hypothetical protein